MTAAQLRKRQSWLPCDIGLCHILVQSCLKELLIFAILGETSLPNVPNTETHVPFHVDGEYDIAKLNIIDHEGRMWAADLISRLIRYFCLF